MGDSSRNIPLSPLLPLFRTPEVLCSIPPLISLSSADSTSMTFTIEQQPQSTGLRNNKSFAPQSSALQLLSAPSLTRTTEVMSSDPYDPFFIPSSILFHTTVSAQESSPLFRLPPELLLRIFQHVCIPYFQVCLALTCKIMGRIASTRSSGKHAISPWRGWRDKEGLFRLLERRNKTCPTSQSWIPRSLRLCRACFLFVPHSPLYWETKRMRVGSACNVGSGPQVDYDRREVNWHDILAFFDNTNNHGQQPCPECTVRGYISYFCEREFVKDRIEAEESGARVEESAGRGKMITKRRVTKGKLRPCPDLWRRIDRP